jgi:hypothetical protein
MPNIDDLSSIDPEQFSYDLLERIFWQHHGKGAARLQIGGIVVAKQLILYFSNSGKTKDWKVIYSFTDANGERHEFVKESRHSSNRRNDPNRDYGLYE